MLYRTHQTFPIVIKVDKGIWSLAAIRRELRISWHFIKYDWFSTIAPGTLFLLTTLITQHIPVWTWPLYLAKAIAYFWLYVYTFTLGNQTVGAIEDKLNKPDRPIPSGMVSVQGAKLRWYILSPVYLLVGLALGVGEWALLWFVAQTLYNFQQWAHVWWKKNAIMGVGVLAQLAAAWQLVAPLTHASLLWISIFSLVIFVVIGMQDMRDVSGDIVMRRRTLPIRFGEMRARWMLAISVGLIPLVYYQFAVSGQTLSLLGLIHVTIAMVMCLVISWRVIVLRSMHGDHVTYELLVLWYNIALLSGIWLL
jgi:4-hydroxybenzoate polyprenyltransferase